MEHVEVRCKIDGVERGFKRREPCAEAPDDLMARKYPNAESRELLSEAWEVPEPEAEATEEAE